MALLLVDIEADLAVSDGGRTGETIAVIGHVASLTVALGRLCALGAGVWGNAGHERQHHV